MHADNQAHVSQSACGRLNTHMATLFQAIRNAMQSELCQNVSVQAQAMMLNIVGLAEQAGSSLFDIEAL